MLHFLCVLCLTGSEVHVDVIIFQISSNFGLISSFFKYVTVWGRSFKYVSGKIISLFFLLILFCYIEVILFLLLEIYQAVFCGPKYDQFVSATYKFEENLCYIDFWKYMCTGIYVYFVKNI
jgi:hypothetical protein